MSKKRLRKTYKPTAYILIGCFLMYILLSQAMAAFSRQDDIKELENEVELLNDDDYVTRYARENYVFTRDGEQVVILPDIDQEK